MLQSPLRPKDYGWDKGIIQLTQMFGGTDMDYTLIGLKSHNGIDFRTKHFDNGNAPVIASHDGRVISDRHAQSDTGGRFVKLFSPEVEIEGKKCKLMTIYFHLKSCRHDINTQVKKGQLIGLSDNTGGFSTGSHLHFGLYIYWKKGEDKYEKDVNNGWDGAVDPMPYLLDNNVYQYGDSYWGRKFFYNGKTIQRKEVDALIPPQFR